MFPPHPSDLTNQFILTREPLPLPPGWVVHERLGWCLAAHPALSVLPLRRADGTTEGWMLGIVIDDDDRVVTHSVDVAGTDKHALLEALARLRGRFALIVIDREWQRIYPDPAASLGVVFGHQQGPAASTTSLLDKQRFPTNRALTDLLGMPTSDKWYPFGLTPRQGITRLLPNHFLDLTTWQQARYWPTTTLRISEVSTDELIGSIAHRLRGTMAATAAHWPIQLPLTAGKDSRVLLAAAREVISRGRCFVMASGRVDKDVAMARKVAERAGVGIDVLRVATGSSQDFDRWMYRTGDSVAGRIAREYVTLQQLNPRGALLPGNGGAVGKGVYWRPDDFCGDAINEASLTPETLLRRIKLPVADPLLEHAAAWLRGLAAQQRLTVLDLLYLEQRLGCWAGPQQYGVDSFVACHLSPYTDRVIFEAMLGLSVPYKRENHLARDLCHRLWPELAQLPFNQWPGFRGWIAHCRARLPRRTTLIPRRT